ncbi:MAG: acyltransferase [Hymenobacter sp.]|nr:MAG: acyltransferase [Hymenobacter sp.]
MLPLKPDRHFGLDVLRVLACYMVVQIHTGEFYYIGPNLAVLNTPDAHWVGWYNSVCRACVPLFVLLSGYFLFPVGDTRTFFKKRFSRVAVPFTLWCMGYAVYQYITGAAGVKGVLVNILNIPVNYGVEVGHLWFVYMLLGIYLFAPIISPWVHPASRRSLEGYLALWAVACCLPYIHLVVPAIWGEAFWNHTPMLYYFSGFLGYAVLGAYFRRFHQARRLGQVPLGLALLAGGYAITAYGFLHRLPTEQLVNTLELTWGFETINVAFMTTGIFLLFKNMALPPATSPLGNLVLDVSAKSYGMYLAHIMLLNVFFGLLDKHFGSASLKIPLIAACTFVATYGVIKLLSLLPKSKWLVG